MAGGGNSINTVTAPSPFDAQSAETAKLMQNMLMPLLMSGLKGNTTYGASQSADSLLRAQKYNAGRFGISAGDPSMQAYKNTLNEGLTKPNQDMLAQAMQMYGLSTPSATPGSSITTNKKNSNGWDYAGAFANGVASMV